MAIQHPNGAHSIVRPAVLWPQEARANEHLWIGPALRLAKTLVTPTHPFIHVASRTHPTSIQGDTRPGRELYYIRYVDATNQVEHVPPQPTMAAVVAWLTERDLTAALGEWDVTVFPRADQLPTMQGGDV